MITMNKKINERFFDEESKEMYYVLGVSYSRYSASNTDSRNSWRSSSWDLLNIIGTCLESEHTIGEPDTKGSRLLQFRNKHIQNKLEERGLGVPRAERKFPDDIEDQYLDHFVRGFFDAQVSCSHSVHVNRYKDAEYYSLMRILNIRFNPDFLRVFYSELVKHANLRPGRDISRPRLKLTGRDVELVYHFIYRDMEFNEAKGLYLPSKKEKFQIR